MPRPDFLYSAHKIVRWRGEPPTQNTREEVSGAEQFQHPRFLRIGWERSRAVGLFPGRGTGFLVSPSAVMTNWHVFRRADWAEGKDIAFDVELGLDGLPLPAVRFSLNPSRLFFSDEESDFAIVGVDGNPGDEYGYINATNTGHVSEDTRVNIVQHPRGGLKQIAIRENGVKFFDDSIIQYWTDTDHGSSGSPVFDDQWNIVGIHYKHDVAVSDMGDEIFFNEANSISSILTKLQDAGIHL